MSYYHEFLRNKITKLRLTQNGYSYVIKKKRIKNFYNGGTKKICKESCKESCIRTPSHVK